MSISKVVIVLGIGRSGSSLLAAILERMGCIILEPRLPENIGNPRGYFESAEILALNESILRETGLHWDHLFLLRGGPVNAMTERQVTKFSDQIGDIIQRGIDSTNQVGRNCAPSTKGGIFQWLQRMCRGSLPMLAIKDPRITLLLPLWVRQLDRIGLHVHFVLNVRRPSSVINSLASDIYRMPPHYSELLWIERNLLALRVVGQRIVCIVHYEDWFSDPDRQFKRLSSALGMGTIWNFCPRLNFPQDLIDKELDHSRITTFPYSFGFTEELHRSLRGHSIAEATKFAMYASPYDIARSASYPVEFALHSLDEAQLL